MIFALIQSEKLMSKLNDKAIYSKEFNVEFKGYSMKEVDAFLDEIILDYQNFHLESSKYQDNLQKLQQQNASLQAKIIELEGKLKMLSDQEPHNPQTDLLKRLAKLEQEVYNK
jgi:cell division initiation protein